MTNLDLIDAIRYLVPEAQFSFQETDLSTLVWDSKDIKRPSDKDILAAVPVVKAAKAARVEANAVAKAALLDRLGITADEAKLLLA
jgi:hypothetical protein